MLGAAKKMSFWKSGKVPLYPKPGKKGIKQQSGTLAVEKGQIINKLHPKELRQLLGKCTYPCYLDFSLCSFPTGK